MKQIKFGVWDTKAEYFIAEMSFQTEAQAIRAFINTAKQDNNDISSNPEDFALVKLGTFDNVTGEYENVINKTLGTVITLAAQEKTQETKIKEVK